MRIAVLTPRLLLDVLQQWGLIIIGGLSNLIRMAMSLRAYQHTPLIHMLVMGAYPVKEASSFTKYPAPFCEFHFPLLQSLVAVIQRSYSLLQTFAPLRKFIDFRS